MFLLMTSGDKGKTMVGTRVPDACPATVHGGKMSAIRRPCQRAWSSGNPPIGEQRHAGVSIPDLLAAACCCNVLLATRGPRERVDSTRLPRATIGAEVFASRRAPNLDGVVKVGG